MPASFLAVQAVISRLCYLTVHPSYTAGQLCGGSYQGQVNGRGAVSGAPYIVARYCSNFWAHNRYDGFFLKKKTTTTTT